MINSLRRIEYNVIPGHRHPNRRSSLRFSFLSSVPSIDSDPNPLFYLDRLGNVMGCNRSFEKLVQIERFDLIGKTTGEVFPSGMASIIQLNLNEMHSKSGVKTFFLPMAVSDNQRLFMATITETSADLDEPIIICTMVDVSGLSKSDIEKYNLYPIMGLDTQQTASHLELLIRSEKIKNQILEWLGKLNNHLSSEGRSVLSTIVKQFKRELCEEIRLRSEKEFDEKYRGLYDFLSRASARITKNEMRLCALLSQNNSSTEIARLTCKSVNSVNVAFARIRMKLGLLNNNDLKDFLASHASIEARAKTLNEEPMAEQNLE